ncbi:MAG: Rrf2 family transcriptional regulator [Candidatus Omnitrophica bacterium]|nr:Rrf2 family transcriptional regulator [Candidatus Omnitrophota bacterium]MBU4479765.1 Rrf2 family transcriptional regulator [Candidatus Omnitrophota bacterium]MCG2703288.1 Rrf2 family transcriptional regulator [Candidatus Omnitrophota bacterium]
MKMINKNTDYAVRALMGLAKETGEFVSSREVGANEKIPLLFLRRILQSLIRAGLVEAKEGVAGGVRLVHEPRKITVAAVMEIMQGKLTISDCMFRKKACANRRHCVLRKRIQGIEEKVISEFAAITIQDLLDETRGKDEEKNYHYR